MHSTRAYARSHPIKTGFFVVLGVLALGTASALTLGYGTPAPAEAFVTVSPVTVIGASTAASSVTSTAATVTAATVVNTVVSNVVAALTVQANPLQNDSNNNNTVSTPSVTDANGVTTVQEVVAVAPQNEDSSNTNPSTEPCCTETTPAISLTPPTTTLSNPFTLPCCTVPTTSVTTPSVPVVITPTVVTITDICINIDGVQTSVPTGMTRDGSGNCNPPAQPVVICTLTASASAITPGQSVTLSWSTQNATSFVLNQGIGAVTPTSGGSRVVQPTGDTTYVGTAYGPGGPVTCQASVTVSTVVNPPSPICTLTASASSVTPGSPVTLSWTTTNVSSASIDNGVGAATPVFSGNRSVVVNANTTYTLTGIGTNGQTVTCSAPVTVSPVVNPPGPICTLTASAPSVAPGSSITLSWTTNNVSSASIDNGVGAATPVASGNRSVVVNANTTYTLTGIGTNGQTVTCSAPVVVTPPPPTPICTLSASAGTVAPGTSVDLVYTTTNVSNASIDNGVGNLSPVSGGTRSVIVNADTTYTLTGTGTNGQPVTCAAPVRVSTGGGGSPICTLTASPTSIKLGDSATITWGGNRIVSVSIDNGIGPVSGVSGSTTVTPTAKGTYTYIGSFLATNGSTLTCQATIEVTGGGGGCTSNCGGGGSSKPRVVLSSLKTPGDQPLSFVYLSQIPYTGLDLGPLGTALYWMMLILWSLAAAYLVLFNGLPLAYRKVGSFGANVKDVLKQPVAVSSHTVTTHAAPAAHAPAHHAAPSHTASHGNTHEHAAPAEAPKGYQAYQAQEGFRSFATEGALSIDDIVKGLAREAEARPTATAHDIRPDFMVETSTTAQGESSHHVYVEVPSQAHTVVEASAPMPAPEREAAPVNEDVRTFIAALLSGDRETVFGTIRGITRTGGDSEAFLTHAVCALDDAYRSRVDGSVCHPDIAAVTADCHPSFLERVVSALTTAVDGSYSTGVTGVKLALTRALAVVNG